MLRKLISGDSMLVFSIQRVIQAIPSVFVVITIGFILINLAPGDPVAFLLGDAGDAELEARIRERLGLDAPLHVRYYTYITGVLQGQLGRSHIFNRPVAELVMSRLPATLLLFLTQFIFSGILGIAAGIFAAYTKGSWWDKLTIAMSVWWYSVPVFWSGQLMLIFFALRLNLFPSYGMRSLHVSGQGPLVQALDIGWHLVLPALALALLNMALVSRMSRSSMVESLRDDYIVAARAKGISELRVVLRHAFHNAFIPVLTVLGLELGRMMSGSVLVETVFSWPGLGRLMYDSILMRDYPVVLGLFLVISLMVIIANLLTDLVYAVVDPRVRFK
jgi:ABC-type dipeptide/oligopeptide/nickel transport system permease component